MITHLDGDLLQVQKTLDLDFICHQVNCQGMMGSGIAKQIRETYPQVYENYKKKCDFFVNNKMDLLGQTQIVALFDDFYKEPIHHYVCNLFAQYNYGYDGKRYTSYDGFWNCLNELKRSIQPGSKIGFPYLIGCDRGGANWNVIETMIKEVFEDDYLVYIIHYDGGK